MFCKNFFNTRYLKEILWLHLEPLGQYHKVWQSIIRTTRFVFRSKNHVCKQEQGQAMNFQPHFYCVAAGLLA
jgi:hypothetical protein